MFGYVRFLVSQWFVGGLLVVLVVAVVLVAWLRVVLVVVVTIVVVVVVVLEHSLGIYCWHTHAMLNAAASDHGAKLRAWLVLPARAILGW